MNKKYTLDPNKLFKNYDEANIYVDKIFQDIEKTILDLDKKLNIENVEEINKIYREKYNCFLKSLEKAEAYAILSNDLNINDLDIAKLNNNLELKIRKIKIKLFEFGKKLSKLRKKEEQDNKIEISENTDYRYLNEKIIKFNRLAKTLRKKEINARNVDELNKNLSNYIEIYKIYTKNIDEYSNILSDISIEKLKEEIEKAFNEENILKIRKIKKEIYKEKNKFLKEFNFHKDSDTDFDIEENFNKVKKDIILSLNKYEKKYVDELTKILEGNNIDYFKRKNKVNTVKTITKYEGYIYLQNDINKEIERRSLIHELSHLIRYRLYNVSFKNENILMEETLAILNEFLLLDYLLNKKDKSDHDFIEINEIKESMLSKIFDTVECFLLQNYIIDKIKNDKDIQNSEVIQKRKELLKKFKYINEKNEQNYDERRIYSFVTTYSYLKPYYSVTYLLGVLIAFNIFKEIKLKKRVSIEEILDHFNKDIENISINLKGVLNYLIK